MKHCRLILSSVVIVIVTAGTPAPGASPVNVVLIMTDDQAVWSLGCYGGPDARTPAIDRLAADGVRLTRAFATTPVCSPSRATFRTGRIPSQHGIHDWIKNENIGPRARYCLEGEVTISDILAAHGYTCGLSGKWHIGDSIRPHAGFTWWFALPTGGSAYQNAEMVWQDAVVPTTGYLTDRITDRAIEFLNAHKDKPFYLEVQYNAPHSPYSGHPQDLLDLYTDCPFDSIPKLPVHPWASASISHIGNRDVLRQYFAACSGVDRGVQAILARLDELGLSDNTLVIYTSDQGYSMGHHGLAGKGNASNPRNAYDTALQIPLIFRHKGRLLAGRTVEAMIGVYDFLPTVLDYLGLPPSTGRNLPGRSFARFLAAREQPDWPDAVFGEYGRLRYIRTATHKYVHRADGGPFELYDLVSDPDEARNLADDPQHQDLKRELRTRLFEWFERYAEIGADPVGNEYLRPDQR